MKGATNKTSVRQPITDPRRHFSTRIDCSETGSSCPKVNAQRTFVPTQCPSRLSHKISRTARVPLEGRKAADSERACTSFRTLYNHLIHSERYIRLVDRTPEAQVGSNSSYGRGQLIGREQKFCTKNLNYPSKNSFFRGTTTSQIEPLKPARDQPSSIAPNGRCQ